MILPSCFDHPEEAFSYKEVQNVLPACENQFPSCWKHENPPCCILELTIFFMVITFLLAKIKKKGRQKTSFRLTNCAFNIVMRKLLLSSDFVILQYVHCHYSCAWMFGLILRLWRCTDVSCWFCEVCSRPTGQVTYKGKRICNSHSFELTKDCLF